MRPVHFWNGDWFWSAALLLTVSLHFWFPELGTGTVHDTYSTTMQGKKAFYLLVGQRNLSARRNVQPLARYLTRLDPHTTLCLLGPARYPTADEWDALANWVSSGGSVLITARRDEAKLSIDPLDVEVRPSGPAAGTSKNGPPGKQPQTIQTSLTGRRELSWKSTGAIQAANAAAETLVEHQGTVQAVRQRLGQGRVVVVASDFIFSNEALLQGDNSVLAYRLLESAGTAGPVVFDESLNTSGTPKVVSLLLHPPLRPLCVQLLIGLIVFGWWDSRRFGPVLPHAATARHNIVDHTDAVGRLRYRLGDGSGAVRSYLKQLFGELHLKSFKGREEQVLNPIALRMGRKPDAVRGLLRQASRAARSGPLDRRTAAAFIRQLVEIRRAAFRARDEG